MYSFYPYCKFCSQFINFLHPESQRICSHKKNVRLWFCSLHMHVQFVFSTWRFPIYWWGNQSVFQFYWNFCDAICPGLSMQFCDFINIWILFLLYIIFKIIIKLMLLFINAIAVIVLFYCCFEKIWDTKSTSIYFVNKNIFLMSFKINIKLELLFRASIKMKFVDSWKTLSWIDKFHFNLRKRLKNKIIKCSIIDPIKLYVLNTIMHQKI